MRIKKVKIPADSRIKGALNPCHYSDAFAAEFVSTTAITPVDMAKAFFTEIPSWVDLLLKVRSVLAKVLGLKHPPADEWQKEVENFTGTKGESIALFQVYESTPQEIIMGADDSHLDFRVCCLLTRNGDSYRSVLTTVVKFNNWTGRAYFLPVRPIHCILVPILLKRMIRAMGG